MLEGSDLDKQPLLNSLSHDGGGNEPTQLGLSNLQKHQRMLSSDIYMIGGDKASKLSIRQLGNADNAPWSDPILMMSRKSIERIVIPRPLSPISRPLVLCAKTQIAPVSLGGIKTKVVSLYSRYSLVNRLAVEVEVISTNMSGQAQKKKALRIGVNKSPVPWHFDDSGFIRLRPKELGKTDLT